ncbi:MAG: EamA family transporter [Patescibacteria group bacterium]|nr:EamA family transporter [Patescibacteria group bacterium]
MSFVVFAWTASFVYGLEAVVTKIVGRHLIANQYLFNFFWLLWILIFTVPLALGNGVAWPRDWFSVLTAGLFYALSSLAYILALYQIDVTIIAPLYNFRTLFSLMLGVFWLKESLGPGQLILIGFLILSGVLVTYEEKFNLRSFLNRGIFTALAATIFSALMGAFIKYSVAQNGYWTVTLFMPLIGQLVLLASLPKFLTELKGVTVKNHLAIILIAVFGLVGTLCANRAYAGSISLTTVILSLPFSMMMAFILSRIFPSLMENHSLKVYAARFAAAAVMIAAAVKLSLM